MKTPFSSRKSALHDSSPRFPRSRRRGNGKKLRRGVPFPRVGALEILERRELLSAAPLSHGATYRDLENVPIGIGIEYGVLAGLTAPSGSSLTAKLVDGTQHGVIQLRSNGTFQYMPDTDFVGVDYFTYRVSPDDAQVHTALIDVMTQQAWDRQPSAPRSASPSGGVTLLSSTTSGGLELSVSDVTQLGGTVFEFAISLSGGDIFQHSVWYTELTDNNTPVGDHQELATGGADYLQNSGNQIIVSGSGTFTVGVGTHNLPGSTADITSKTFNLVAQTTDDSPGFPPPIEARGLGTILIHQPQPCICYCDCDPASAPAKPNPNDGGLQLKSGPSPVAPNKLHSYQSLKPHPIISADDVLSSAVGGAANITAQLTLYDSAGAAVYAGAPIYYSPAGYAAGSRVRFAQQVDAGLLATGAYQWTMTITENYASVNPIIRNYGGFTTVRNLDSSPYGSGWMPAALDALVIQGNGVSLTDGSGNAYFFQANVDMLGNTTYVVPDALWGRAAMSKNADGSYTLAWNDASLEQFNSSGQLTSRTDPNGNVTSYTYVLGSGALATITDFTGTTTFNYMSGMLASTVDFAGRTTSYTYDAAGRLTSVTLPDPGHGEATPQTTYAYDSATGLLSSYANSSGTTTITYDAWRSVTRITHPNGTYKSFSAPLEQALVNTSTGLGGSSNPAPLVYLSNIVGTETDENGNTTRYTIDQYGLRTSSADALGNTTAYEYDAQGRVTKVTEPPLTVGGPNLVTQYAYDNQSNLTRVDFPDGTHATWTYDSSFNKVTSQTDPAGRVTTYTLDATNGNVLSMTQVSTAGNLVTSYTYTPAPILSTDPPGGLPATITDPRGIVTAISYNAHGLPIQIVYAQGTIDQASVSLTYDSADNPATYTDELGRVASFSYDNLNRLIQTLLPAPDPNNPAVAPVISAFYNALGKKTSETDPLGRVSTFSYGAFGHLTRVQQPDPAGGVNYTVTQFGDDAAGNRTTISDPLGRIMTFGYDSANRQTSVQAPNPVGGGAGGPTKSVVYDALGNVIKSFDFGGNATDLTYDAMGRVLSVTGPAPSVGAPRPVTAFTYNADGQVLSTSDPLGHTTTYVYDDFGRLTQETLPDPDGAGPLTSSVLHWSYDADNNLVSQSDALGHVTAYAYDFRNRRTSETNPLTGVTRFSYDRAGNLTSLQDPDGNTTLFVYDGLNRLKSETNPLGQTRSFVYDLAGNLIRETDRNGRVREFVYDGLDRETACPFGKRA